MKIMALKDEGHKLIDRLVSMGTERTTVYHKLRKQLKRHDGTEHFSNMRTIEQCQEAVERLHMMVGFKMKALEEAKNPTPKTERRRKRKGQMLAHAEMQRAFAELRARRGQPTRWQRIINRIKSIVWE